MNIDWKIVFDEITILEGATTSEIENFAKDFSLPLTNEEIIEIKSFLLKSGLDTRLYDPAKWTLPAKPFPEKFLEFLNWNNGGWCRKGAREFGFLGTNDLRNYCLNYMFPEWMPGAVPFALNGGGVFYIFDMCENSRDGEYPILICESGTLGYEEAKNVAHSFLEVCSQPTNIENFL